MAEQDRGTSFLDVAGLLRKSGEREECAQLVIVQGTQAGQCIDLGRPITRIGRRDENHLVLDSETVSRTHACVEREENQYRVVDLGARNGVYLNGRRIQRGRRCLLGHGDSLALGDVLLLFRYTDQRYRSAELPPIDFDRRQVDAEAAELLDRLLP
ncbi:MAG: FHA domain-containing protein [Ectothiorhodospiraceae bacterium]|nr:FHA domain-containing protein [Ectothiorhodospiraceae bacterium]MCH8506832.1 FHA domain-containing protein [Ectothiorhodospiraceae bacterium]